MLRCLLRVQKRFYSGARHVNLTKNMKKKIDEQTEEKKISFFLNAICLS